MEQLGLRCEQGGSCHFESSFEQRQRTEFGREPEVHDRRGVRGGARGAVDVQPCGSRRQGPSMRIVWHW